MTPKNYRQILDKKFTQLITEQEQEQIKLEQKLQEHDQLKSQLAEAIRRSHYQGQVKRKKVNRQAIQQKKYELKQLEAQIEQLEDQFEEKKNNSQQNQEEVELLGKKIENLKKETEKDHNKDQLQRATHTVQELSQSFQGINQQHQFYKNQYIQLQQEIKNHQIRYNQLIASSAHYEQESEKLNKELQRIVPKMQAKQLKLEELENLKFRLESEINQKTSMLEEERIALKQIEDEMNKTNNNEKLIKQELKAQTQLQQERKLLLDEFHRICALSGIDKLATSSPNNENDLKQQQNQQTIEQQDIILDQLQQDIQYLQTIYKSSILLQEESLANRKNELIQRYSGLEKQMDDLSKKFQEFEKQR
ncbi:hypothetical protein pb186bvf_020859 [Paramecium bursaria]